MNTIELVNLFKCLADKSRLQILECLSTGDMYVEKISQILDLAPSTVSFHLKKMNEMGLVKSYKDQYYTMFSIVEDTINRNILELIKSVSSIEVSDKDDIYRKEVLSNFIKNGHIEQIPVQRKKRIIVLSEIAKAFKVGVKYSEKEVNLIIAEYNDDFCYIRKELVNEGIMKRDNGEYWYNEEYNKKASGGNEA